MLPIGGGALTTLPTPYYSACACGCGESVAKSRRFVSGHNLLVIRERTAKHRAGISEGQRRAWQTKRTRFPVGTTRLNVHGYTIVKVIEGKGAWRLEHQIVMEEIVGRPLTPEEEVHHINAVRTDNDPENLYLCRDKAEHSAIESSFRSLLKDLLDAGLVIFDREEGRYRQT